MSSSDLKTGGDGRSRCRADVAAWHLAWALLVAGLVLSSAGCGEEPAPAAASNEPFDVVEDTGEDTGGMAHVPDVSTPPDLGFSDGTTGDGQAPDGLGTDGSSDGSQADGQDGDGPDAGPVCDESPAGFLCPCIENEDCQSGYCIGPTLDPDNPYVCTEACITECPNDWPCKALNVGSDPIFICVPQFDTLCVECVADSDCGPGGDICMEYPDGRFCGRDCSTADCPDGYSCESFDEGGLLISQCVPDTGSCLCGPEIDYQTDPNNCGSCGTVCELFGATSDCDDGQCILLACNDDYYNLNGENDDGCEYQCVPDLSVPDTPNGTDLDCDGLDGAINRAVFVSATLGNDGLDGGIDTPVATLAKAFQILASNLERDQVYIAAGTYEGQVLVPDGISLYGGFSADGAWVRDTTQFETVLTAEVVLGETDVRAVILDDLPNGARLDGLTIRAGNVSSPGGSSYGVWVRGVSDNVVISGCRVVGGSGAPGNDGTVGSPGKDGAIGLEGTTTTDTDCNCNEFDQYGGPGGAGGASACPDGAGMGGKGADGVCGDGGGTAGSNAPGGAAGGPVGSKGADGDPGGGGPNGVGGNGGDVDDDGLWRGNGGTPGTVGVPGQGGGGGSSGKGDDGGTFGCASWGGGGGGGGSAGCGGQGGGGGQAGGGSFGVFVRSGTPRLEGNILVHRSGGKGGNGGPGGDGGLGKDGGAGGGGNNDAGSGKAGGKGGDGGRGGFGGGGAGGPAYGLFIVNGNPVCVSNSFESQGDGGTGGGPAEAQGTPGGHGDQNQPTLTCQ